MESLKVMPAKLLTGNVGVPGDKSISHRAAMFSALATGSTCIKNFLKANDCLATVECLKKLGVVVDSSDSQSIVIYGKGNNGIKEPENILDAGNSGTTMRLMTGILASFPFFSVITGDDSLRERPMDRIINPLTEMGAVISGRLNGSRPPLAIRGGKLNAIEYRTPVASAQVKSAVLLAALQADGKTTVTEPMLSRDHTERMLKHFGVNLTRSGTSVTLHGPACLESPGDFTVPGDISSAAFFIVAASIIPGSDIVVNGVGINPARTGIFDVLREMGAHIEIDNVHEECGEPVADIRIKQAPLKGITLQGDSVPRLIDEIPVLAVAAAMAEGKTIVSGAEELKYKETNRIKAVVSELKKLGVDIEETEDGMIIYGLNNIRGGKCHSWGDHRMAMALAVAGLASQEGIELIEPDCMRVSFPGFIDVLKNISVE